MTTSSKNKLIKTTRAIIRDRDSKITTRPTIARTGDQERLGKNNKSFNDLTTITYLTGASNVNYPFGLQENDRNLTGTLQAISASTPGIGRGGGIITTGNITKGVPDNYIKDIPGAAEGYLNVQSIGPFVELGLHAIESASLDDPFYKTGSKVSDIGIGFTQPLKDKTKIEIDLTPTSPVTFGYTQQGAQPVYYPMAYYNFSGKTWDSAAVQNHGYFATGYKSEQDINDWLSNAPVGFTRGTELIITGTNYACRPCANFGFPVHPKFHARDNFVYPLSGVLNHPFLFEKFVYEVDIAYTLGSASPNLYDQMLTLDDGIFSPTGHAASILTFFIMNQRAPFSASVDFSTLVHVQTQQTDFDVTASLPNDIIFNVGSGSTHVDDTRDLVTYGQILSYSSSQQPTRGNRTIEQLLNEGLVREVNLNLTPEKGALGDSSFTQRKLIISGTVKRPNRIEQQFGWRAELPASTLYFLSGNNIPGGRTNIPMAQSGRDFVATYGAGTNINSIRDTGVPGFTPTFAAIPSGQPDVISPYLLMPGDNLVFGWQVPHLYDASYISGSGTATQITIHTGSSKLTLYGSLIKNNSEFHDTLNQNLVSDAIHETLHYDNPVLDQYDTVPYEQLSGSYIDYIITGSLRSGDTANVIVNHFNPGQPEFHLGTTLNDRLVRVFEIRKRDRNTQCYDEHELFYDCLLPRPDDISNLNNSFIGTGLQLGLSAGATGFAIVTLDVGERFKGDEIQGDDTWTMSYPFEPRYSDFKRDITPFKSLKATKYFVSTSEKIDISPRELDGTILISPDLNSVGVHNLMISLDQVGTSSLALRDKDVRKYYYGIGDLNTFYSASITTGSHNLPIRRTIGSFGANTLYGPEIRGWKYGVRNGIHEYSKSVFRRDRFGQVRDMLEQRPYTKFFNVNSTQGFSIGETDPTVTVGFFDTKTGATVRPYVAPLSSSNLSYFATASLPYFDGDIRN